MDTGVDRKAVKGRPGVHIHYYTSQAPKVYSLEPSELPLPIVTEKLCTRVFTDEHFTFDEKDVSERDAEHSVIRPGSMHVFQLWDCETRQYKAPNDELSLTDIACSKEFVLRIRFKYPPSLEKQNFSEVWESGAFYYYFLQCRHDFIHDILHDVYHSHVREDLCIGLALVDMARLAFEKRYTLKQLKDKYEYHAFLPRHVAKKTKGPFVKFQLNKTSNSALDETFASFYDISKNPHRHAIVSYLKQLLPSVPEYASEEFTIKNHLSKCDKLVVHPYSQQQPGIYLDMGKNALELVGTLSTLTAIDLREPTTVLLHFTDSKAQHLEFVDVHQARSFLAMLDGYYRLMFDYHYSLSNQVYSPIVKLWSEMKCYGPLSLQGHGKDTSGHKDYLKVIWRRNAGSVGEGTFLIKQRSSSFTDFVMIIHKMGRNFPAIPILYNKTTQSYSCEEYTMRQLFQSHHRELSFANIRELIRYYRSGDFKHLKLTSQLSPVPKEEVPLMVCRDRTTRQRDSSFGSAVVSLQSMDTPALLSAYDIRMGKTVHVSSVFDLMEGTYGREKVLIKRVRTDIHNQATLTLFFQKDVQKVIKWQHDTIVRLYGICLSPFFVMSQRMVEGRLDHLLKRKRASFQLHHCIQATGQLAQALMHLESHTFTHGAIRCKSVLVSAFDSHGDIEVKLTGDMLSAYMSSLPLTDKLNVERLPWIALERWTNLANETIAADVYSFGMTIWEIFSHGERPLATMHTIEQVKRCIESDRAMQVPTSIEAFKATLNTAFNDRSIDEQYNILMNVVYQKIILNNISSDPSGRMRPQDIVKEMILLNCRFTPTAYDPIGRATEQPHGKASPSSADRNHHFDHPNQHPNGHPNHKTSHNGQAIVDAPTADRYRPLPSIPLPTPPSQPHIISPTDLIGFEDNTAERLGQGYYGEVYKCKLRQKNGRPSLQCAVKKLLSRSCDMEANEKELKEFEQELKLMVPLAHKNIVRLYGECFYPFNGTHESRLIVMEFVRCGNLLLFVREKGKLIPLDERLQLYRRFCMDIAEGMTFLHNVSDSMCIIHRDLAARNVLITDLPHTAKITDFGLARTLRDKDYYRCSHSSILPFLWCAPESMSMDRFTKASDVWSYAVVLWEMFSGGLRPYISSVQTKTRADGTIEVDIKSLIDVLSSSAPNTRLPKLRDLSPDMYNLMMKCWQSDPARRPTFECIKTQLQSIV